MKWLGALWSRWFPMDPPLPARCDDDEISRARRIANEQLRRALARAPEVARVAREARAHRAENHFAEMIEETFRKGEG